MSYPISWSDTMIPLYPPTKLLTQFSINNENISPPSLKKLQMISNPKKIIPSIKPTKNTNHSIRAGDWICLLCNNLNFSFRSECNRCQKQTKKQNYIQNLMLLNEEPCLAPKTNAPRKPLADLTNMHPMMRRETSLEKHQENQERKQNYGFENVLLLTPPKSFGGETKLKKLNNYLMMNGALPFNSPNSETNKKITKPYNSPQQIPSISPILKPDFLRGSLKAEEPCARNLSEFLCDKIYEDSREDELGCSNEENKEEPIEKIFSKLMDEDTNSSSQSLNYHSKVNSCVSFPIKENEPNNLLNTLMGFMNNASYLNLNACGNDKDLKGKKKNKNKTGNNTENERKSDWYCPNCNNLNYSFRFVCNRCQAMKPMTPL